MRRTALRLAACAVLAISACSGSADDAPSSGSAATQFTGDDFPRSILPAVRAVDAALGGPQEYFEVTASERLVNLFVAVEGGTAVRPYVWFGGELQPPAPDAPASGQTFGIEAIDFDPALVLSGIRRDLPDATIDTLSIEGGPGGFVRYIVSVRSAQGGVLDVVVAPLGAVIEVDPL